MTLDPFDSLIDMAFNRTVELSGVTGTEVVCVRGRLSVVDPQGQPFNPELHEAIATQ